LLDANVVLPVVPEVMLVQKPLALAELKIPQPDLPGIVVKAMATIIGNVALFTVDDEPMEMAVRPPHDELEDMVKVRERGIRADRPGAAARSEG